MLPFPMNFFRIRPSIHRLLIPNRPQIPAINLASVKMSMAKIAVPHPRQIHCYSIKLSKIHQTWKNARINGGKTMTIPFIQQLPMKRISIAGEKN
jgi:hypothetical protein